MVNIVMALVIGLILIAATGLFDYVPYPVLDAVVLGIGIHLIKVADLRKVAHSHRAEFVTAMDDDFNTPEALAAMQKLARNINSARDRGEVAKAEAGASELRQLGEVLGLFRAADWFHGADDGAGMSKAEIEQKLEQRKAAKSAKEFATADRIRDELAAAGIIIEDKPSGVTWRRK